MASIENRIVSMQFQNEQFKKGSSETIKALDDIDLKLGSLGKDSNIEGISGKTLSTFVVTATALSRLTNFAIDQGAAIGRSLYEPIVEGGKKRALNIEQAKFQFRGLGMDVEEAMANSLAAVRGTAYGLDAAARTASQLGASGVKLGTDMTNALTGISGVAAMTGSSYEDISSIFTKVAGQGRLMGDDLNRLGNRGLNVASDLAKAFGVTEAELRAMVSKGEVHFQDFANVMNDMYGEHATKANETFMGAQSNYRAALSRLGAMFATDHFESERIKYLNMIPAVDALTDALKPLADFIGRVNREFAEGIHANFFAGIESFIQSTMPGIESFVNGLENIYETVTGVGRAIFSGFTGLDTIPNALSDGFNSLGEAFENLTEKLMPSEAALERIAQVSKALFDVFTGLGGAFKAVGSYITAFLTSAFSGLWEKISQLVDLGPIGEKIKSAIESIFDFKIDADGGVFGTIIGLLESFAEKLRTFTDGVYASIPDLKASVAEFFSQDIDFSSISNALGSGYEKLKATLGPIFSSIGGWIGNAASLVAPGITSGVKSVVNLIGDAIGWLLDQISQLISKISPSGIAGELSDRIGGGFRGAVDGLDSIFGDLKSKFGSSNLGESMDGLFDTNISEKFSQTNDDVQAGMAFMTASLKTDGSKLKTIAEATGNDLGSVTDSIGGSLKGVGGSVSTFLGDLTLEKVLSSTLMLSTAFSAFNVSKFFSGLGQVGDSFSGLLDKMSDSVPDIQGFMDSVGGSISDFVDKTKDTAGNMLKVAFALGVLTAAVVIIAQVDTENLIKALLGIGAMLGMLTLATGGIVGAFKDVANMKMGRVMMMMLSLGAVIMALAVALRLMATADPVNMAVSMIGLMALLYILGEVMEKLTKLGEDIHKSEVGWGSFGKLAFTMGALAVSVLILSGAIKLLGGMDLGDLAKGGVAVALMILGLVGALKLMSEIDGTTGAALAIVGIALGVAILTRSIQKFGEMDEVSLVKGLGAVAGALLGLGLAMKLMGSNLPQAIGASVAIIVMAFAIKTLAGAVVGLAELDPESLMWSLMAILTLMAGFGAMALMVPETDMMSMAAMMLAVGVSIAIIANALMSLAQLDPEALLLGVAAIGVLFALLGVLAVFMPEEAGAGISVMLLAIGVSLLLLAFALTQLAAIPIEGIGKGLLALGGALLIVIGAGYLAEGAVLGLAALAVVFIAIGLAAILMAAGVAIVFGAMLRAPEVAAAFIAAMALVGDAVIENVDKVLLLALLTPILLPLALVVAILGAGLLMLGAGLLIAGAGAMLFAAHGKEAAEAFEYFVKILSVADMAKLVALAPLVALLGVGMLALGVGSLLAAAGLMVSALGFVALIKSVEALPTATDRIGTFGLKVASITPSMAALAIELKSLADGFGRFTQSTRGVMTSMLTLVAAMQIAISAIKSFTLELLTIPMVLSVVVSSTRAQMTAMSLVFNTGFRSIDKVINNYTKSLNKSLTSAVADLKRILDRLNNDLRTGSNSINSTLSSALTRLLLTMRTQLAAISRVSLVEGRSIGHNITVGIVLGIQAGVPSIRRAATNAANSAKVAAEAELGIRSPSRVFMTIGEQTATGMAIGITNGTKDVEKSGSTMAKSLIDSLRDVLNDQVYDEIESLDPTIVPIVDLSEAKRGLSALTDVFAGSSFGGDFYMSLPSDAASSVANNIVNHNETIQHTYTQNITSPRPLSRAEIFRRTRTHLAMAKE